MFIREMVDGDCGQVADLACQLSYPNSRSEIASRFSQLTHTPDHTILVGDEAGEILGWTHLHVHVSLVRERRVEILALVIREGFRGRGLGLKFLARAEEWARERAIMEIELSSNTIRDRAHRFYLSHGYAIQKTSHKFFKNLN